MDKPFFDPPPMSPGYTYPPGPSDAEIVRRMKDAYIETHPDYTDDDIDVIVERVSRYGTNFKLVPKPKISSYIKVNTYIGHKKDEDDLV